MKYARPLVDMSNGMDQRLQDFHVKHATCQLLSTGVYNIFTATFPISHNWSVCGLRQRKITSVWLALLAYFKCEPLVTILLNQSNNCINIWKQKYFVSLWTTWCYPKICFVPFKLKKHHSELVGMWLSQTTIVTRAVNQLLFQIWTTWDKIAHPPFLLPLP